MEDLCPFDLQSNEQQLHATLSTPPQIREEIEDGIKRTIPYMVEAMKSAFKSGQVGCQCNQQVMALVKEAMNKEIPQAIEAGLSKHVQQLRVLIRTTVEDVLQRMSNYPISRSLPNDADSPVMKTLRLRFVGTLPDSFLTLNNITTDGAPLLVELVDMSGSRVEVGPESCAKIKLVVLDGDYDAESRENNFNESVVKPRKDKGALLKGECDISLMKGVAIVSNLAFTDNSKSMRNGCFRLGAHVVKVFPGVVITEAVSEAFKVKERRLQSNGKEKKPSLDDNVSCLKHIGTTFSQRLADMKVNTVRDFLQLYHTNEKTLRKVFRVTNNKWSEIVANAKSCSLTKEEYHYREDTKGINVVLDCIFNIVSVAFEGQSFQPFEILDDSLKELIYKIRCNAYEKRSELPAIIPNSQTSMQVEPLLPWNPHMNMYLAGSTSETGPPEILQNMNYCAPVPDFMPSLPGQLSFGIQEQYYDHQNTGLVNPLLSNNYEFNNCSTNNAQSALVIPESIEQDELWARCIRVRWRKLQSVVKMIVIERSVKHGYRAEKRQKY